jgi:hypothetical protein
MVPELSPQTNKAIALSYSAFGLAIGASLGHQVAEKLTGNNHLLLSLKKWNNYLLWKAQTSISRCEGNPASRLHH